MWEIVFVLYINKARIFLLVDSRDFFRFRVEGESKSFENDQSAGHFQSYFLIFPEQTVKPVK